MKTAIHKTITGFFFFVKTYFKTICKYEVAIKEKWNFLYHEKLDIILYEL